MESVAILRLGNNYQSCILLVVTGGFLMECLLLTLGRLKKLRNCVCMPSLTTASASKPALPLENHLGHYKPLQFAHS